MKDKRRVILPGSYDPVTVGHLDMIKRAAESFSEVYAVCFINPDKEYTFSIDDRVRMLILATEGLDNVIVSYSLGRVVDYMREHEIDLIVKGYRNGTDLEYERRQAEYNKLHGGYETLLWEASRDNVAVSSSLARDMLIRGEDPSSILPSGVIEYVKSIKK